MLRCREIRAEDLNSVVDLLACGIKPDRWFCTYPKSVMFWWTVIRWMEELPIPPDVPKYGYCLEADGHIKGVLLLFFTVVGKSLRCNVSSWYVEPEYRLYASLLSARATRRKGVTYFNLTPAAHTYAILESQGFSEYASQRLLAMPAVRRPLREVHISAVADNIEPGSGLSEDDIKLMRDHTTWGCISLVCEYNRVRYPFVFKPGRIARLIPISRLIYCRDLASLCQFAGAIGRYFLRRGFPLILMDADEQLSDIPGILLHRGRRYWKGPAPMRLGDMAYSEMLWLDWRPL